MDSQLSPLDPPLNFPQARVLGCLIEKEMTLPEYYPLTLNALVTACNQSTNRDPVTNFDDATVIGAMEALRLRQWAFQLTQAGARVPKFKHNLPQQLPDLDRPQAALLAVLLLRGAQTLGELRQRTERLHSFPDLESVEEALQSLIDRPEGALAKCLPTGGGRRVPNYQHLLCGDEPEGVSHSQRHDAPSESIVPPEPSWKDQIEQELAALRKEVSELSSLRSEVTDLKRQLGLEEG